MVPEIEIIPQNMVEGKTVVLKARFDSDIVRLQAERLKRKFFTKLGFFKPKEEEIQLVGYEKYYEPYIVIGGKYSLDYCKKHAFSIEVEKTTREVFIEGVKYKAKASKAGKSLDQMIHLEGEEHAHYEKETFFILDRLRREISPDRFSFAPYEVQLKETANINNRKISISTNEITDFLRSKIAKRPSDLVSIIREFFEITENMIVYRPFFEFTFNNTKTKEYVTLQIDGISGDKVLCKFDARNTSMFSADLNQHCNDFGVNKTKMFSDHSKQHSYRPSCNLPETSISEPKQSSEFKSEEPTASVENLTLDFSADISGEVFTVGDNVTAVVGDLEIPSEVNVNDTLVVKGRLKIGDRCTLARRVKVLGDITVGINTVINGDIISGGNVTLGSNSTVRGCVKAAGRVKFGENVLVGKEIASRSDRSKEPFNLEMIVESEREKALV